MIHIAYCDDNELQRSIIEDFLDDYTEERPDEFKVSGFESGEDLIEDAKRNGFADISIIDMLMPSMNGMETALTLRAMGCESIIIFLTASVEYAVMSYDVDAFYYVTKPFDSAKMSKILDRASETLKNVSDTVDVKTGTGEFVRIKKSGLLYVDIRNRALCYHLKSGQEIRGRMLRGSFKSAASNILSDRRFVLCGASMIVNISCIDQMDEESVLLTGGRVIYPPRSACSELKKLWLEKK